MKAFLYDRKHQQVHSELDLGVISQETKETLEKVFSFLKDVNVFDRYKTLKLADSYKHVFDDGELVDIEFLTNV